MSANYGITEENIFKDSDFKTPYELLLWFYTIHAGGINYIGLRSWVHQDIKAATKMGVAKIKKAEAVLINQGKIVVIQKEKIWCPAKAYYNLYKGKYTPTQLKCAIKHLKIAENSLDYGQVFVELYLKVFRDKYLITIPYSSDEPIILSNLKLSDLNLSNRNGGAPPGAGGIPPIINDKKGNGLDSDEQLRRDDQEKLIAIISLFPNLINKNYWVVSGKIFKIFENESPETVIYYLNEHRKAFGGVNNIYAYLTKSYKNAQEAGQWGDIVSKSHKWFEETYAQDAGAVQKLIRGAIK